MRVFATYNIKGGVGKTASAVNLAYLSARDGSRTLVWDLDPQGAATFYFRIRPKIKGGSRRLVRGERELDPLIRGTDFEGLDLLPADFSYRHLDLFLDATKEPIARIAALLEPLEHDYDHVFLDCAPSISLVSESIFGAADVLLVPTIPTTLSLLMLDRLNDHLLDCGLDQVMVLPFFCMADRRKSLHRETCDTDPDGPYEFLSAEIPYSTHVEQMGVHRAPLATYAATTPPALAYEDLWREIKGLVARTSATESRFPDPSWPAW